MAAWRGGGGEESEGSSRRREGVEGRVVIFGEDEIREDSVTENGWRRIGI